MISKNQRRKLRIPGKEQIEPEAGKETSKNQCYCRGTSKLKQFTISTVQSDSQNQQRERLKGCSKFESLQKRESNRTNLETGQSVLDLREGTRTVARRRDWSPLAIVEGERTKADKSPGEITGGV
jgi:hypothetical protein